MNFPEQYIIFIFLAPLATLTTLGIFFYAWRHQDAEVSLTLMWLTISITGWLIFNTLELVARTAMYTVLWSQISYPFIVGTSLAWLAFAFRHTHQERWLRPQRFLWLCIIPCITVILVVTNAHHKLIWQEYYFLERWRLLAFNVKHGSWFWVHIIYSYVLVFWGAFLVLREYFRTFTLYRHQSAWLLVGALAPVLTNMIYAFEVFPMLRKDYTPISFAFASLAFSVGVFRYHLLDIRPVARDMVVDSMQDAMVTLDLRGRIVDVNPVALNIITTVLPDITPESIIGTQPAKAFAPWREIIEEKLQSPLPEIPVTMPIFILQRRMETHAPAALINGFQTEINLDLNKKRHYFDMRVSPIRNRRHKLTGLTIILRDITARKEAEAALRDNMAELEARNEQLDAFAHTVAHDLKNPLTSVLGYSRMLQYYSSHLNDLERKQYLNNIAQHSKRMADIVDALFMLASVHRSDEIERDILNMPHIIAEVQARLADMFKNANADLVAPQAWPNVRAYGPWIEEVWVNYISNAIKYGGNPEAGIAPHIEVGWNEEKAEGRRMTDKERTKNQEWRMESQDETSEYPASYIRFWVRDNGPGLTAEQQAQLFQAFSRLDTERAEGHGLGLSIVQRIIEKFDGEVGVESTLGEGSTFWFTLPCQCDE